MSRSQLVPSTALLATTAVAVVALAAVLFAVGSFDVSAGDSSAAVRALRTLRTLLLLVASCCSFATVLVAVKYHRNPDSIDGKWMLRSTTSALVCLVAAWILGAVLGSWYGVF